MITLDAPELILHRYSKYVPPRTQLLKWVGNKQKFASEITKYFPSEFNKYYEPFLGSGAVLATVRPIKGIGSDTFKPLIEIWNKLKTNPDELILWYKYWRDQVNSSSKEAVYEAVRNEYNNNPNGKDFLYLSRACYGGIIRFRRDGHMSTPCGVHTPIPVNAFAERVKTWQKRVVNTEFIAQDYKAAFATAAEGDLIYCDPPYSFSQSILYGAQDFSLSDLLNEILKAKSRGVFIALSIDGNKKSGNTICNLPIPDGLFEKEMFIDCGKSMLRRFQVEGQKMKGEGVFDRLLLTY
jgi:DNA adenine methylase